MASSESSDITNSSKGSRGWRSWGILYLMIRSFRSSRSPLEHLKEKYNLDTATKLARAKPNKHSGDADLSKDKSGPDGVKGQSDKELSANVDLTAFVVASEHNEEMVNAEVDGSDPKRTDDTVAAKSRHAFVQCISVALEGVVELVKVGSGRASSGPNDVVVALSIGEKGDGLVPSSTAGEEAAANSYRV
ncbi:hypothetical protein Tco_0303814 [Tanacetum coccineum]